MNTINPYSAPLLKRREYTASEILQLVSDYFQYPVSIIIKVRKMQSVARPRHIATYLLSTMISPKATYLSVTMKRDRTAIIRSIDRCIHLYKTDHAFQRDFDKIIDSLDISITMRYHIYKQLKF
ncbi:MAG: helix-turn-helix domain-containing protein [Bacteroidales bacterium]|nr:helix-turn-helix domain-containing protein [Bacteroidales bacterium]